ncbi:LytTR family DNA-binding domain-containing protein [Pseudoblastomonas halimionae]|uniref:LytTR family DNA-binding domain-containing protein n=1 Tax=Alteriqipengyuania halimionae TaxID=1926630 RepID=UPI002D7FAAD6|nr:LytTR family DNA-binding domain-containing protein [Alteriqipengyuania halimionae]
MRTLIVDLSVMTVIGIVLALIGPFGSANAPLAVRLVSWIGFAWLGFAIYRPMQPAVAWLSNDLQLPEIGAWIGVTLVATIPLTVAIWCIGFLPDAPQAPTITQAFEAYFNVLVIGASVTIVFNLIARAKAAPAPSDGHAGAPGNLPSEPLATSPEPSPRFLDRLPASLGTELLALEMEDHYVRAHTPLGSELVLMRMRDAVAELDGIDGAQVHRSWWVARGAVEDVKRDGRNLRLVLDTGLEAPVSRANVKPLRDAGWF